jgi:pSer/pThr/pTyr-binding forkhead associated (FHA) protein
MGFAARKKTTSTASRLDNSYTFQLSIVDPLRKEKTVEITSDRSMTLGRTSSCSVCLKGFRVSREQCLVGASGGRAWIEHGGSKFPTLINGKPTTKRTWIRPGDTIKIDGFVLKLTLRNFFQSMPGATTVASYTSFR